MTDLDTETRAAVAALVYRLDNRGDGDGKFATDNELLAGEFITAMTSRGWYPLPVLPPGAEGEPGIREATRELLIFACATRPDWTADETWNAVHAARTAGLDWDKLALRLMAIALREEDPPTRPRELWDYVRGITSKAAGRPPPADYLAAKAAKGWTSTTGGQPVLDENDHREAG